MGPKVDLPARRVDSLSAPMAAANLAPEAMDPVLKYAVAPLLRTRQSAVLSDVWNWSGVRWSLMG